VNFVVDTDKYRKMDWSRGQ